jgi:hypothetical protein
VDRRLFFHDVTQAACVVTAPWIRHVLALLVYRLYFGALDLNLALPRPVRRVEVVTD